MAEAKNGADKTAPSIEEKVAALEAENASLKSELKDAVEIIEDLKDQLKNGEKSKVPTVKIGKIKYKVVGAFRKKGKLFTQQDIAADPKLAEDLVKRGSELLQAIK